MDEKSKTIKQLRLLLEDERRAENTRHHFAVDYFDSQLEGLKKQCLHPEAEQHTHYSVFPEDTWVQCTVCGASL